MTRLDQLIQDDYWREMVEVFTIEAGIRGAKWVPVADAIIELKNELLGELNQCGKEKINNVKIEEMVSFLMKKICRIREMKLKGHGESDSTDQIVMYDSIVATLMEYVMLKEQVKTHYENLQKLINNEERITHNI